MKALTISQPFASLIASGEKWVENRTWETKYRGPLAIHAGKGTQYLTPAELRRYPAGIVAVSHLAACFRLEDVMRLDAKLQPFGLLPEDVLMHRHAEGPWCWLLRDVRTLAEPYSCRGAQGLWETPKEFSDAWD